MSQAGPVSRAGPVCRDLGTPSRDPGIAMPGSRLTGLKIFHVIAFTGPAQQTGTTNEFASEQTCSLVNCPFSL